MKQKIIKASAPGKIHFIGEHSAVYFKPAILASIDKRCTVEFTPTENNYIEIISKNLKTSVQITIAETLAIRDKAQKQWEKYRDTNDIAILKNIVKDDSMYPVIAIGETFRYFEMEPQNGFHLTIDSEIPIGSGHGSSAAVAVSVVGAVSSFLRRQESTSLETIGSIAIRVEQKKHGNPSYGDVAAVINGGLIWFTKESPDKITIKPLDFSVPKAISENLMIIQSGIPVESTGEMVHNVALVKQRDVYVFEQIIDRQEALTHKFLAVLKQGDREKLPAILTEAEENLEAIGVVSDSAQALIRKIERTGGAAKICGAGGKTQGSGIILAYHTDKKQIETIAKENGMAYYSVQLGGKGLEVS